MVSADLVTDAPLHHLADLHRQQDATLTALLYEVRTEEGVKSSASMRERPLRRTTCGPWLLSLSGSPGPAHVATLDEHMARMRSRPGRVHRSGRVQDADYVGHERVHRGRQRP